jgi:mono/diheme cytochrome c family protein
MKRLLIYVGIAIYAMAQTSHLKDGDRVNGKRVFLRAGCYQCHGTVGQGGQAGARLAQTKLPLAAFTSYVRNPAPGGMPPYREKVLSDQDLADIYAYIQSVPPPLPLSSIPLLK